MGVKVCVWSADESALWLGVIPPAPLTPNQDMVAIWRVPLRGTPKCLTHIARSVDWLPLPDGSGMVATTIDPRTRKSEGEVEVRARVNSYSFTTHRWRTIAISPWESPDMGIGDHPALRRHNRDWVLSFHLFGPADSQSYWVNLTTGHGMEGEEGDPLFEYSPNGRYVIAEGNLYAASCWPRASRLGFGQVRDALLVSAIGGEILWSPDSCRLLYFCHKPKSYSILTLSTLAQSPGIAMKEDRHPIQWAGAEHLLIYNRPGEHIEGISLADLTGAGGRMLCRLADYSKVVGAHNPGRHAR